MSLIIDDPRVEANAQELARRTGVSPAEAVAAALEARLGAMPAPPDPASRAAALAALDALREQIARERPQSTAPLDWETLKSWARDEDEGP